MRSSGRFTSRIARDIDWRRTIRSAQLFRFGVLAAAAVGVLIFLALDPPNIRSNIDLTLIVALLVIAGRSVQVRISSAGSSHMGTPALLAGVLILDPTVVVLIVMFGTAASDGIISRDSRSVAFNVGQATIQAFVVIGVLYAFGWSAAAPAFADPGMVATTFLAGGLAILTSALLVSVSAWLEDGGRLVTVFWEILTGGAAKLYWIDFSKICFGVIAAMLLNWSPLHVLLIVVPVATMSRAIVRGISLQGQLRDALRETEHSLTEAQHFAGLGSWEWELVNRDMHWSDVVYDIAGIDRSNRSVSLADLRKVLRDPDQQQLEQIVGRLVETHGSTEFDHEIVRADGSVRHVHHVIGWVAGDDQKGDRLVGTMQDITERKDLEIQLRYQAYHDGLTGLPNRELFLERLAECLRGQCAKNKQSAVIFADIDHFKEINDRYGHEAGDEVLIEIARRLAAVAGPKDTVARLSGDEFTVLAYAADYDEPIEALAHQLLESLQAPVKTSRAVVPVSASAGLVFLGERHKTPSDILREADEALYRAKNAGRNRLRIESSLTTDFLPPLRDLA